MATAEFQFVNNLGFKKNQNWSLIIMTTKLLDLYEPIRFIHVLEERKSAILVKSRRMRGRLDVNCVIHTGIYGVYAKSMSALPDKLGTMFSVSE